ncbi:MAG TPA: 16S rRNA (cytosine(1402)-N(4))-methyltransferase RsmH [Nitrospinota bacterium]|nr:16S rRNA (cytosine(1402)-N(4))-methyltransferase RsmH [Nitrospinota bacterium]
MKYYHIPVLLNEILDYLLCGPRKIFIDCTLGEGGHAFEILKKSTPSGILIGIDKDKDLIKIAIKRLRVFQGRFHIIRDDFKNIKNIISLLNIKKADGILFDLGISSRQLGIPERGFSFKYNGPLDMRMDTDQEITAFSLINNISLKELIEILRLYGEERWSQRIARRIVDIREKREIRTTKELAEIVKSAIPLSYQSQRIHPATKTFQALRIDVNKELDVLKVALKDAIELLKIKGRLCVVSFHSLEDRIVKNIFNSYKKGCTCSPRIPKCICGKKKVIEILTKKPLVPSLKEIEINPRSRGAKLRVAEKIA